MGLKETLLKEIDEETLNALISKEIEDLSGLIDEDTALMLIAKKSGIETRATFTDKGIVKFENAVQEFMLMGNRAWKPFTELKAEKITEYTETPFFFALMDKSEFTSAYGICTVYKCLVMPENTDLIEKKVFYGFTGFDKWMSKQSPLNGVIYRFQYKGLAKHGDSKFKSHQFDLQSGQKVNPIVQKTLA